MFDPNKVKIKTRLLPLDPPPVKVLSNISPVLVPELWFISFLFLRLLFVFNRNQTPVFEKTVKL